MVGRKGTSPVAVANGDDVIMAADDLVYRLDRGTAIPMFTNVPKVFAAGNLLIDSAGLMDSPEIKYKCDNWITDFIETHGRTTKNDPTQSGSQQTGSGSMVVELL